MNLKVKNSKSKDLKLSIALMASFVILTFQYLILIVFDLIDTSLVSIVQIISKVRVLTGTYSHNFFIDVLSGFGVISGLVFIVVLLFMIIRTLLKSDKFSYDILFLWLSIGFVYLRVSGTYLTELKYWIFLGVLISAFVKLINIKKAGTSNIRGKIA